MSYSFSIPDISLQNEFADFVAQKEQEKAKAEESIKQFEAEKEHLIEKYFK